MKIAFLHFYTFRLFRGIETLIISLANALVQMGIEVSIVTARPKIRSLIQPNPQIKIFAFPTFRFYEYLTIVPFYVYHFLHHEYDQVIVFFADYGEGMAWRIIEKVKHIPLTLYLCYPYSTVPHRYHSIIKLNWHKKARLLAVSSWVAGQAQKLLKKPVDVLPVGTDPHRFFPNPKLRDKVRRELGYSEEDVVLLNVSSLEPRKGIRRVVQAMERLHEQFPQLRYFILGQGNDEPNLRDMIEDSRLQDYVVFGGITSQLEAYYNMADIFVMLSDAEPNSVACHEAMSCGLPVIV